uniref:Ubiquitin-like protease family profile domain-containing protein n=1 Tax=Fagus sylvatica TaxID=28930 RepID=A0A2N9FIK6_FAGSY
MARRKRKVVTETILIDCDAPSSSPTDASFKAHSNLTEPEADEREWSFAADSSSLIPVRYPRRQRSKRKIGTKNEISLQEKLNSGAFECYFQSHWSLLIFCHFGESLQSETRTPCMLLLDSLEKANPRRLEPEIRKFVLDIYKAEGRLETKDSIYRIPLLVPEVPQQRNDVECGSFVLYFINLFVESAPEDFSMESYPYFMKKNWFTPEGLESFCKKMESLNEKSDVYELL